MFELSRPRHLVAGLIGLAALTALGATGVASAADSAQCQADSPSHKPLSEMTVGFAQAQNLANPFRAGETASIRSAAKAAGIKKLVYANADSDQAKQVSDIQAMINQGVDALIVAPLNSTGLQPAFKAARAHHIPVITIDRHTAGKPCRDFIAFMGSDFHKQAVRAAQQLVKATGGQARIVELQGAYGNSVETARTKGFAQVIDQHKGMQIVAKQPGDWSTTKAQKVMSQILLSHPDVNAVFAQSDNMALGAIKALQQFGMKPGRDVKIVTIDGVKAVVKKVADGEVAADVETNPRFGPRAFSMLAHYADGKPVPEQVIMHDTLYTPDNAATKLKQGSVY